MARAAAAAAAGGGSGSARALARSVAHRLLPFSHWESKRGTQKRNNTSRKLDHQPYDCTVIRVHLDSQQERKYYIDVQRKENSFVSSGLIRDELESFTWHTHPARLIEWAHGQPLEHNFNRIKLEAYLRMHVGSAEECHRKVQESPEKQKDLEKFIKEMAKDYVPDRMNEGRSKGTQRQSIWPRARSSLHRTASPSMSAEEVQRLVSSASKFIVAATSDAPPKALGTTGEVISTPKRRATKSSPCLGRVWKQSSSTQSRKDVAESTRECGEEFKTELKEKTLGENGGKKPKTTKKKKNVQNRDRPSEMSSSVSWNSYTSAVPPKSNDLCLANVRFTSPYSPPGPNQVPRKGILKNRMPVSRTSSEISPQQNPAPNARWKGYTPTLAGHACKPAEIKRKAAFCTPIGVDSKMRSFRSRRPLARQPVLTSGDTPQETRSNTQARPGKQTAEPMQAQSSKVSEETGRPYSSTADSGCAMLKGEAKEVCDRANWKSNISGMSQGDGPEASEGGLNSVSERDSNDHHIRFQEGCKPRNVEWKHNSDSCSSDNPGRPRDATLPIASADESGESPAYLREDRDNDHILAVTCGPSLGYPVGQGTDEDAPDSLARNESVNIGGHVANRDIEGHSGNLLYHLLCLSEADGKAVNGPTHNDLILGEPWDQQMVHIPPTLLGVDKPSEDCSSAFPDRSTPVWLANEASDEEFTISSLSSSLSAKSLSSIESRNPNAELKKEENANSCAELPDPNVTPESSTARPGTLGQHTERLSSSAGEERTNKDPGPEDMSTARVVYFSHLPTSL